MAAKCSNNCWEDIIKILNKKIARPQAKNIMSISSMSEVLKEVFILGYIDIIGVKV